MSVRCWTFVAGLLTACQTYAAEITYRIDHPTAHIDLLGDIDARTPTQLAGVIKKIRSTTKGTLFLRLDSGGGDMEAAISSGLLIREYDTYTVITEGASCASACTLLFVGGVVRIVAGRYGIHRPYSTRHTASDAEARRSYVQINKLTRDYLEQVNVTPRLLEAMNVVSPGDVRWLSKAERAEYGIESTDPIFEDRTASAYAKRLGITKQELFERQQRAKSTCKASPSLAASLERVRCYQDIVEGRK